MGLKDVLVLLDLPKWNLKLCINLFQYLRDSKNTQFSELYEMLEKLNFKKESIITSALLQEILSESKVSKCVSFDLSIASTKTKYIKLNTKIQNIFCRLNENLTTFLYTLTLTGAARKQSVYKS